MNIEFLRFVRIILPSCFLLAAPAASRHSVGSYREVFSSPEAYLDLYFQINPKGRFQRDPASRSPVRFEGYWVTEDGEEFVSGTYQRTGGKHTFQFRSGGEVFFGEKSEARCEAKLSYRWGKKKGELSPYCGFRSSFQP